jgi:magnesium chelatase family protein
MVVRIATVAFAGVEALPIDVQVQISSGNVAFTVVGLADKAVAESRERVRSALVASGLALPAKRITVNLAPADLPKEGSHYDLPIALGVMAAIGAIPGDALAGMTVLGELALDGTISAVAGVLPAAVAANARGHGLICPAACGPEAAWASADLDILAPRSLIQLANHFSGAQVMSRPSPSIRAAGAPQPDLADIRGQESAKRALEIAAAGGHNLLMNGPPGAGKSMLAQRLPSILPPLAPAELLEVSMIHSIAGALAGGELTDRRPFRAPHHSASMAALVGGGVNARPGEVSLAHHGVLFLDELPEFQAQVLDSLRQPIETGEVAIARANHRVVYPARFQLVAAMNPCRCGHATDPGYACKRQPNARCMAQYQARLSGPLLDRIDLNVEVPAVTAADLLLPAPQDAGTLPAQLPPSDAGAPADLLPAPVLPPPAEESIAAAEADEPSAQTAAGGPPKPPKHHRVSSRDARVRSGKNYPMQGAMQSPLARIGIPPAAVPAVATAAAVGATAFWPFLIKTLSGLLKSLLGSYLKNRAKKDKKIDDKQRAFVVLGFRVRPAELGSLFLAATVYGLAVCYTLKGWKLDSPFVLRQETLVLAIYYSRSFIRFTYERLFGLVTQFRFWPGGGLLCLGSAYLGNTLGTVGYDLEAAKSPEAAERAIRLKVWLIVIALGMALAFFTANWLYPQKVLQSGRVMTSGMALAEILPIAPMPGQKIYRWRRKVWVLLCVVVVPTFFLINFFL